MIKAFFQDKFEYDFRCNQMWCETLMAHEDELNDYIKKSFSHIINVHHIWLSRLTGTTAESHSWDILPINYWERLNQDNFLKTNDYLEKIELNREINYHSEEDTKMSKTDVDILYHILNHSNYHRAQIARELRKLDITPPSFNFIAYH